MNRSAILTALASAALFGVSTPAAKALLSLVHPVILAGAGIGIAVLRNLAGPILNAARQQPLARQDYRWLTSASVSKIAIWPVSPRSRLAVQSSRPQSASRICAATTPRAIHTVGCNASSTVRVESLM